MTSPKRFNEQENEVLPTEMLDFERLLSEMHGASNKQELQVAWSRVCESFQRRRRILNLVQEALSQLRLDVKYLMFDLETTRRERDQLQAQLEEDSGL